MRWQQEELDRKGKGREVLLGGGERSGRGKGVSSTAPGRMRRDEFDESRRTGESSVSPSVLFRFRHSTRSDASFAFSFCLSQNSILSIPAFKYEPQLLPLSDATPNPAPTSAPPPLTNALASSSKTPQPSSQFRGLPPPPSFRSHSKPISSFKITPDPLPLLALPIPPHPNLLLPTSSAFKTNPTSTSSPSLLGSMPPPPLPPLKRKPDHHSVSSSASTSSPTKRPIEEKVAQPSTKRSRHLGLGAGMSKLSKVPSLLSSIRGVQLVGGRESEGGTKEGGKGSEES